MTTTMNYETAAHAVPTNPFLFNNENGLNISESVETLTLYSALRLAAELEARRAALASYVDSLEKGRDRNADKAEFYDYMANTDELFNTGVTAKTVGTGKTKFLDLLRKLKVLMPSGNHKNLPYQKHINAGRLAVKWIQVVNRQTGERKYTPVPLFTGKGLIWIKQLIEKYHHFA